MNNSIFLFLPLSVSIGLATTATARRTLMPEPIDKAYYAIAQLSQQIADRIPPMSRKKEKKKNATDLSTPVISNSRPTSPRKKNVGRFYLPVYFVRPAQLVSVAKQSVYSRDARVKFKWGKIGEIYLSRNALSPFQRAALRIVAAPIKTGRFVRRCKNPD